LHIPLGATFLQLFGFYKVCLYYTMRGMLNILFFCACLLLVLSCKTKPPFSCTFYASVADYTYDTLSTTNKTHNALACNITYANKDNGTIFNNVIRLALNCNNTFTYANQNCLLNDTSYGTWHTVNETIFLQSSPKVKAGKIVKRGTKNNSGNLTYVHLNHTLLPLKTGEAIFKTKGALVDTLLKH
jgi:hypothetical protein